MSDIFSRVNSGSKCWRSRSSEGEGGTKGGGGEQRGREGDKGEGKKVSRKLVTAYWLLAKLKLCFKRECK